MTDAAALERRYRRMLVWFPAQHRQIYEEEMIGVLLASASDGQRRPSFSDVKDLAGGGLRTRLGRTFRLDHLDPNWRDAFAAYSVAAPILMLPLLAAQLYTTVRFRPFRLSSFAHQAMVGQISLELMTAATVAMVVALIVAPALIQRQQRLAVGLVALVPAVLGLVATTYYDVNVPQFYDLPVGFTVFFTLEVIAVALSRDPGRGWRVLGWKSLIAVAVVAGFAVLETVAFQSFAGSVLDENPAQFALTAITLALVLIFGSSQIKYTLALLAIPAYPILGSGLVASLLYPYPATGSGDLQVLYLPTLVIAVLVTLAMWQSSRQAGNKQVAAPA